MMPLKLEKCQPCREGTPPLSEKEVQKLLVLVPAWLLTHDEKGICKTLRMKDFLSAVELIRKIAEVAEKEDHHPDLHLTGYRNLRIELSTHAIGGLSRNDFIVAAKMDALTV